MLDRNGNFLFASNQSFSFDEYLYLSGTLIIDDVIVESDGYVNSSLVLSKYSMEDIRLRGGGRFLVIGGSQSQIEILADSQGSESLFLYRRLSRWIVSNSFCAIVEYAKSNKWRLTPNEGVASSFFIDHSIGRTLLSPKTLFEEIELVPLETSLLIDKKSKEIEEKFKSIEVSNSDDYKTQLASWFLDWGEILSCVARSQSSRKMLLDLSGGVDSRLVLSLILPRLKELSNKISIFTQANSLRDFEVAKSLGSCFDFDVTSSISWFKSAPLVEQFEKYKYSNLGVYRLPVAPVMSRTPAKTYKVNGIGGEVVRNFYSGTGRSWLSKISDVVPDELSSYNSDMKDLFYYSFLRYDIDPDDPTGLREHYRQLRSRIHGGRRSHERFKFRFLSPLSDKRFQELPNCKGYPGPEGLFRDVLLLGGGEKLALHPFDEYKKNFNFDFIKESIFYKNTRVSDGRSFGGSYNYVDLTDSCFEPSVSELNDVYSEFNDVYGLIGFDLERLNESKAFELLPVRLGDFYRQGGWQGAKGRVGRVQDLTWYSLVKLLD